MIAGIGVDLIEISRIRDSAVRESFLRYVYTEDELAYCQKSSGEWRYESLAATFAAKEAAVKALQCGFGRVSPKEIEVLHEESGAPYLKFYGSAEELATLQGIVQSHLSISHDRMQAAAYVILEKE